MKRTSKRKPAKSLNKSGCGNLATTDPRSNPAIVPDSSPHYRIPIVSADKPDPNERRIVHFSDDLGLGGTCDENHEADCSRVDRDGIHEHGEVEL